MDVVIIAVPVNIAPKIAIQVLDRIHEKTLVFDVGSTKAGICGAIKDHPKRKNFVALHPIAGTEFSGPEAAIYDLFTDKVNIICEQHLSSDEMVDRASKLFESLKMRNVFMESAKQHDTHIAYVSHLSHISSFMLGKTVLEIEKDQNKESILKSLKEYIKNLNEFKQIIENESVEDVYAMMENTNRIKEVLTGIKTN